MKLNEWNQFQRNRIASILELLTKKSPDNLAYSELLDGFYSQQIALENALEQLAKLRQDVNMSRRDSSQIQRIITDVHTHRGKLE